MDSTTKTQQNRFGYLCNNEEFADVYFILKNNNEQKRIPAHKLVLSVGSNVFKTMFFGSLPLQSDEVEILDIEPDAFMELLNFFYSNEVQLNSETVMNILYAAKKYIVMELEQHCIDFLKKNLSTNNAFLLLNQARFYNESELEEMCLGVIDKNTIWALDSDCFIDIDLDTLIVVLSRITLQVFESKLFEAIVLWSKVECVRNDLLVTEENQRTVLGQALSLIFYPLMSLKGFLNGPAQSGLLTDSEVKKFCISLASKPNSFETPRCCTSIETPPEIHLKFYYSLKKIKQKTNLMDQFKFTRPVVIVGFALHTYMIEEKSNVAFTLINEQNETIFDVNKCMDISTTFLDLPIILNRPIMIISEKIYTIKVQIEMLSNFQLSRPKEIYTACPNLRIYESSHYNCVSCHGTLLQKTKPVMESLKPLNTNTVNYFSFINCSGIISQIIFYEIK